jgi:ATP-dependent RNA helicase DeaD
MNTQFGSLPEALARALAERGFTALTDVQTAVVESLARSDDLLVHAPTGSGKTIAFGLALAMRLMERGATDGFALVIAPTRELARQIETELSALYAHAGLRVVCCTGGSAIEPQAAELAGGFDVLVGTPGRLRHHVEAGHLSIQRCGCVVLDEADELLVPGFAEDIEHLLGRCPPDLSTQLFTATMTVELQAWSRRHQRAATRLDLVGQGARAVATRLQGIAVAADDQDGAVAHLLRLHQPASALVFCGRRDRVTRLVASLRHRGFKVVALSGAHRQHERSAALLQMRQGTARVCVATDVAARGLDLPGLGLVVHAGLPSGPEALLHRTGRTGRAGNTGLAILMVRPGERRRAIAMAKRIGRSIDWQPLPRASAILRADLNRIARDPIFDDATADYDQVLADALMRAHLPERIALACARMWRLARPMAEELQDPDTDRHDSSTWLGIDIGGRGRAQIGEILALICRTGDIARSQIGRIHVDRGEARFEIAQQLATAFLAHAGHRTDGPAVWPLQQGTAD